MEDAASLVCRVLNTRWPVNAASTDMVAVSLSRISPTIMTSGSCLRNDLRTVLKSKSISDFVCTWMALSRFLSTGFSAVNILISGVLMVFRAEYSVVVFPLPVGPVTRIRPYGRVMASWNIFRFPGKKPSCARLKSAELLSETRMTIASPKVAVGKTETRRS